MYFTLTGLERAKSAMDPRLTFPERVLGKAVTAAANLNAAIGPIKSLTRMINSSLISSSFLVVSVKCK